MLTFRRRAPDPASNRGFSLVELMISMVIGMIVVAGAVSLIVAIDRSNSETIQSIRLTQELRSLAGVISDDVKRTRHLNDPISMVGQGTKACPAAPATPDQPCYEISTAGTGGCIFYGYSGTTGSGTLYNYRYIWLNGSNLELDQYTYDPTAVAKSTALPALPSATTPAFTACPITAAPTAPTNTTLTKATLNSSQVKITSFCVSSNDDTGTCYFDSSTSTCKTDTNVPASNELDVCIAGQLTGGDIYMKTITRAFVQPIFVRSGSPG